MFSDGGAAIEMRLQTDPSERADIVTDELLPLCVSEEGVTLSTHDGKRHVDLSVGALRALLAKVEESVRLEAEWQAAEAAEF